MDAERVALLVAQARDADRPTRLLEALRLRRLLGAATASTVPTDMRAALALRDGRLLVTASDGGTLLGGPTPQELSDQLSALLGTAVLVVSDEEAEPLGVSGLQDEDPPDVVPDARRRVIHLVLGELPLSGGRDAELTAVLGAGMWTLRLARGTVVVPDALDVEHPVWTLGQRPVVTLATEPGHLELSVFLEDDLRGAPRRDRTLLLALPRHQWWVDVPSTPVLQASALGRLGAADREVVDEVQADLSTPPPEALDGLAEVFASLGLDGGDASRLTRVVAEPWHDGVLEQVVRALRLPAAVADVLRGDQPASTLDGAVHTEAHSWTRAIGAAATADPDPDTAGGRYRGLLRRSPVAALLHVVVWLALCLLTLLRGLAADGLFGGLVVSIGGLGLLLTVLDATLLAAAHHRARGGGREERSG